MRVLYIVYAIALTYAATVAVCLLAYGGVDHRRDPEDLAGALEAGAGAVLLLALLALHLEGFTRTLARELTTGSLVSRAYLLAPVALGVLSTDYLLRRAVPLVYGAVGDTGTTTASPLRSRRTVVAATVGVVLAPLLGGLTRLRTTVTPDGAEVSEFDRHASFEAPYFPTALAFDERGHGFVTTIEGRIYGFERPSSDQESLQFDEVAAGLRFPHGVEVHDGTLYTVDNGTAARAKYGPEEGYDVLQNSNGTVVAFDVAPDGSLSNRRTVLSDLPVVNSDHALHAITAGPDDRLYLSVGHLGVQKYDELFDGTTYDPDPEDHPGIEYLGTVISFEPDGSDVQIVARGMRNVYDLAFDRQGNLFGANNDGMSIRSKVWESLLHITEGADFGYPEYGTFDPAPPSEDVADPLWVLDGIQSTGVATTDRLGYRDGVVVGLIGKVVFVPIERGVDGLYVPDFLRPEPAVIEPDDDPIVVEAGPGGYLWVSTTGQADALSLYRPGS